MYIRFAQESDMDQITKIYNYYVLNSYCTFDIKPVDIEYFKNIFNKTKYFIVAIDNSEMFFSNINNTVLDNKPQYKIYGYAYLSKFKDREAYENTSEISIYVHNKYTNRKIGKILMKNLLIMASECHINNIISFVALPNDSSTKLHHKFGFDEIGVLKNVGYKFNKKINVCIFQLIL